MACKHLRLRSVGFRLFCKDCGKELPEDFMTRKAAREKPARTGEKKGEKK